MKRVANDPAFVLHRYDWSESSLILEVFTRSNGRIALVAKGAKKPSSNFRPILLPLQLLQLSYGGDAEIRSLKGATWMGPYVMPMGEALMAGYYLNEMLLKLLARDDPHPRLFDLYAQAVQAIAQIQTQNQNQNQNQNQIPNPDSKPVPVLLAITPNAAPVAAPTPAPFAVMVPVGAPVPAPNDPLQAALRSFELLLLRDVGLLPRLDQQTATLAALDPAHIYCLVPEGGLRPQLQTDRSSLCGAQWLALQQALDDPAAFAATEQVCRPVVAELRGQLRTLLNYHCGVGSFKTRQMMVDLQLLMAPQTAVVAQVPATAN